MVTGNEKMIFTYLAHPVSGDVELNMHRALAWYTALSTWHPNHVFVMSWWLHVKAFAGAKDDNAEMRTLGMQRNMAEIERCDELWLVGKRLSKGMQAEAEHALRSGKMVRYLTEPGWAMPPSERAWENFARGVLK